VASPRRLIAVLGYSARGDVGLHAICAARVRRAEELARPDDAVLLSGWGRAAGGAEASLMAAAWRGPRTALTLDEGARSTAANVRAVARHARALRADELIVVTSSWHRVRTLILLHAALLGSGTRLSVETAPRAWPLRSVAREAGCLLLLPLQVVAARPRRG
jgi:uncharacterized SAM-binding protein YcdF (DUF218 family)